MTTKFDRDETVTTYAFPYMREVNTNTKCQNFQLWLWDPSEKTLFGRTGQNWFRLLLFYAIFYAVLAAVFSISMKGLLSTISETEPKWKLSSSIIGTNPGLGFRPLSNITEEGSLVWYDAKDKTQIQKWVHLLDDFLELYLISEKLPGGGRNQVTCEFGQTPPAGHVCAVDVREWGQCTPNNSYSYDKSSPCFFLKINKIYGWVPEFYDDPNNLPEDMPQDLKDYIKQLPEKNRRQVWITCGGDSPVDNELLQEGGVKYVPERGLPDYYFPYTNTPGYLSPLVAVQFMRPPLNRIINIECRAWAKNIKYVGGHKDRQGSVHFELMID